MQITTARLILREYRPADWQAVLAYQSDVRYQRYYPMTGRTAEDAREFVRMFLDQQAAQPRIKFQLAVTLKSGGELIGSAGLRLDAHDALQGDLGYEIAPVHWGNGYAAEAAAAMLAYGFDERRLHRIWAWCAAENGASARVLEKLGMRLEGRLRENEFFQDRFWDTLVYGILASEWQDRRGS